MQVPICLNEALRILTGYASGTQLENMSCKCAICSHQRSKGKMRISAHQDQAVSGERGWLTERCRSENPEFELSAW